MAILSGQTLDERYLPQTETSPLKEKNPDFISIKEYRIQSERSYILSALIKTDGNISKAADILVVERTYLHKKNSSP